VEDGLRHTVDIYPFGTRLTRKLLIFPVLAA